MATKSEVTNLKIYLRVRDIKSIIKYVEDKGYRPAKSFNTNKAYIGNNLISLILISIVGLM